jgi:hypothetical protein
MALITAIFLFLLGILGTAVSRLMTDEIKAWIPWLIQRVIRSAIARLPRAQRERFEEEWQSHVNDVPGDFGKLRVALGFLTAARKMTLAAKINAPVTALLESTFPAVDNANGLREQMSFVAKKTSRLRLSFSASGSEYVIGKR